jgi:hypothetical protein
MKEVTVVSVISNRYTWELHKPIIDELRARGLCGAHVAVCKDRWYRGDGAAAAAECADHIVVLPRPSLAETSWWNTDGIEVELIDALPEIERTVVELVLQKRPWLMILDDDSGSLEVSLIRLFKKHGVKVALVEHGWPREPGDTINGFFSGLRTRLRSRLRSRRRQKSLPPVAPFGANGSDLNVCISEWTRGIYASLSPGSIYGCVSGNPYFDSLLKRRHRTPRSGSLTKVLVCTTGLQKFGQSTDCFRELDHFARANVGVSVDVRLKPGEQLPDSFKGHIRIASNVRPFYEIAASYDLVIAAPGSLIAIECIVLGVQVAIARSSVSRESPTWKHYCEEVVGIPTIELSAELPRFASLDVDACFKRLQSLGVRYFGAVDGHCAARAASCISGLATSG